MPVQKYIFHYVHFVNKNTISSTLAGSEAAQGAGGGAKSGHLKLKKGGGQ